jgi:hypothetical protein
MSTPLVQNRELVIVPYGQSKVIYPASDYVQFQTLPTGLLVGVNGARPQLTQQASILQGAPGERQIATLIFENTTGGELTAIVVHGTGSMTVAGEAVLSGAVPLPTGASSAALQTTGNASLASLAATTVETPFGANLGSAADVTYSACKSVAVQNTGATGNVTVTIGANVLTLAPGAAPVSWAVSKPLATLANVRVQTASGGSALVLTVA